MNTVIMEPDNFCDSQASSNTGVIAELNILKSFEQVFAVFRG